MPKYKLSYSPAYITFEIDVELPDENAAWNYKLTRENAIDLTTQLNEFLSDDPHDWELNTIELIEEEETPDEKSPN